METRALIGDLKKIERRGDLRSIGDARAALDLVHRISGILNQFFNNFDAAMSRVIDVVLEVTGGMRGALLLLNESDELDVAVARTSDGREIPKGAISIPARLTEEVFRRKTGVYLADVADSQAQEPAGSDFRISSAMCVPLKQSAAAAGHALDERREEGSGIPEEVLGMIYVDSESLSAPLNSESMYLLEAISNHATAALKNARVYMEATRDSLTGLALRRVFEHRLREEIKNSGKDNSPVSLLMTDLDHFKSVNDTYGHQVGDEALRLAAQEARSSVRSTDLVARYGGEEYAVILPGTKAQEALAVAEKIRERIAGIKFAQGRGKITVSVGIAEYPAHAEGAEELVNHADKALYLAKERGRNRAVVWSESIGSQAAREDKLAGILTGDWARDYRNVSMLIETLELLNSAEDVQGTIKAVVGKMVEITDADRGILLLGKDADNLKVHVALDKSGKKLGEPVRFSSSVVQRVFRERSPLAIVDAIDGQNELPTPESVLNLEIRSMMCAPLKARGRMFGAIYVDSRRRAQGFLPADLAFFNALAAQAAVALERRI